MNNLSYEQALKRLEEIVAQLEKDETPLEESLKLYEESMALVKYCEEKLRKIETALQVVNPDETSN